MSLFCWGGTTTLALLKGSRNISPRSQFFPVLGSKTINTQRRLCLNRFRRCDRNFSETKVVATSVDNTKHSGNGEFFYGRPRPERSSRLSAMSLADRVTLAVHSAVTALADPTRADAVAILGEVTGTVALRNLHQSMFLDPIGQRILKEKPVVNGDFFRRLDKYEVNNSNVTVSAGSLNFGQAYKSFMQHHHFHPEERDDVKYIDDPDLAYVMLRYRQIHDFCHVLCDLPPTVLGELALKWLELLQTGLPVAALSASVGALQLNTYERQILFDLYLPWAIQMSQQSNCLLMNVYFEEELDTNLEELRNKIGIAPVPSIDKFSMKTPVDR